MEQTVVQIVAHGILVGGGASRGRKAWLPLGISISHPKCLASLSSLYLRTIPSPSKMDVGGDLIWGDDSESEVFA